MNALDSFFERLQLAILKLAQGKLDEVHTLANYAKRDYRDVLMWAEYPEEGRALWTLSSHLSPEQRDELEHVRGRDRAQYLAWLAKTRDQRSEE